MYSKPLAKIETGRLLLISKCKDEWCKAKTDDYKGWVKKESLWGLF
jgi:SH3-like domain-containing protein